MPVDETAFLERMPDMKELIALTIAFAMSLAPAASSQKVVDVYDVTISLSVPRVYDNTARIGGLEDCVIV